MIIISPYSRPLPNGDRSPKSYPWWNSVVSSLTRMGHEVLQVGVSGETPIDGATLGLNLPVKCLTKQINRAQAWASVDNFFPHMCSHLGKTGVVIWSLSDPQIFGYPHNINLLKGRTYLRGNQFSKWDGCGYVEEAFVDPMSVVGAILHVVQKSNLPRVLM